MPAELLSGHRRLQHGGAAGSSWWVLAIYVEACRGKAHRRVFNDKGAVAAAGAATRISGQGPVVSTWRFGGHRRRSVMLTAPRYSARQQQVRRSTRAVALVAGVVRLASSDRYWCRWLPVRRCCQESSWQALSAAQAGARCCQTAGRAAGLRRLRCAGSKASVLRAKPWWDRRRQCPVGGSTTGDPGLRRVEHTGRWLVEHPRTGGMTTVCHRAQSGDIQHRGPTWARWLLRHRDLRASARSREHRQRNSAAPAHAAPQAGRS